MQQTWPVTIEVLVAWGDMDSLGHVNNVIFLRWFESARIACFVEASMTDMTRRGPILARQEINYHAPVHFPDTIEVRVRVNRLGSTSFDLEFEMRRKSDGARVASGTGVHVWYDYESATKIRLDEDLRGRLQALFGQPGRV